MNLMEYLKAEVVPAIGCTEPASIAFATMNAATELDGAITGVKLKVDKRIYKNCFAVGIPHSGHKTGIKWAVAIGCFLKNKDSKLECFRDINDEILRNAHNLIENDHVLIEIDGGKTHLFVDVELTDGKDTARCILEGSHTNITLISKNNKNIFQNMGHGASPKNPAREWASSLTSAEILKIATEMTADERKRVREDAEQNLKIAEHGLKLFPEKFVEITSQSPLNRISGMVCAGVYARMWGEDLPVMSIAGSGNKGITSFVPLLLLEKEWNIGPKKIEEAFAIAALFTSKTTEELGTLSAVCGCSNAAGIGLACAITYLLGGGEKEISFAINNMVGNVTGMICDGAKIGCALKTMTTVDAAFRASTLAISGIGIPKEDGIIGANGDESLANMGRIAKDGMIKTDEEILSIMRSKL